ncbi:MAG: hypothetical protein R6V41_14295 [Desulfobacteraceae bacterium]
MLKNHNNLTLAFFILFFALLYAGCAPLAPKQTYKSDKQALEAAARIREFNRGIASSKGTGRVSVTGKETRMQYRIAWAAKSPDQARITLISSGMPVETILFNRNRITLYSHTGEHPVKEYKSGNPSLERFLSVPVRMKDIISVLTGKIPLQPFDRACFAENDDRKASRRIMLDDRSGKKTQMLCLDSDMERIRKLGLMEKNGGTIYKIGFSGLQKFESFKIFTRLTISGEAGESAVFRIKSFKENPDLKDSVFNLTTSE